MPIALGGTRGDIFVEKNSVILLVPFSSATICYLCYSWIVNVWKVCFTVTSEIITLPGHLRVLFDKVYEGEPVAGTGWVVWQRVLQARIQDATFFKRLSSVQLACRSLRVEVDGLPIGGGSVTARTKSSWLQAIDQLTSLTLPNDFHLSIPQWKEKAHQSDITLLDTMHVYYNLHDMFAEIDSEKLKSLIASLKSLSEGVNTSAFDGRIKRFVVRALEELRFAAENIEIFGFENAWTESVNLVGAVLRFRNELEANAELRQNLAATAWQVMQFLAAVTGVKNGAVPLADAARALLGSAPAA